MAGAKGGVGARLRSLVRENRWFDAGYRRALSVVPYARRMGPEFWAFYRELEEAQWRTPAELAERQLASLRETVAFAYAHSPFYRRLWDEHGVGPAMLKDFGDFARFPMVDRNLLFNAADVTIPHKGMRRAVTSGTSGTPFQFWVDRRSTARERASIFHQWSRTGFRPGDVRVEMRGYQVRPIAEYPDEAVVRVSVANMTDNIGPIVAELNRRRIPFLHGYPSAIAKFALLLRERGLSLDFPLRGVFFASEQVYEWQTQAVMEVLSPGTLIAHFGTAERVVLGAWCEKVRAYHFLDPYGRVEMDEQGHIVGTSLINHATPFIRYRLNDVVVKGDHGPCPACGRGYTPVVRDVAGRLEDFLVSERGERIPPAVVTFPFKYLRRIAATQIVQTPARDLVLRCVIAPGSPAAEVRAERETLSDGLRKVLGSSIAVRFEDVDELPVTAAGKLKWIVSEAEGGRMAGSEAP